jgi:hypothetical protein
MKNVYVVAWSYDGGGGFDWYTNLEYAQKAFKEELLNESSPELSEENWTATFHVLRVKSTRPDDVTKEVEIKLYGGGQ